MTLLRSKSTGQQGYVLLGVLILMTLLLVVLTIEAPRVAQQIKRDKEEELVHRGTEYKNAVKKFFRKNGRYPMSIDDLEKGNNLRFLRKRYIDPMTGKDDWRILHVGEVQVNIANGAPIAPGSNPLGGSTPPPVTLGANSGTPATTPDPNASGQNPAGQGQTPGGQPTVTATPGTGPSAFATPGGGPMIGVASAKKAESIKEINGKNHYDEWLFFYDPRLEQQQQGVVPGGTLAPGGTGSNPSNPNPKLN